MELSEKTISIFLPTYNRYKDGHLKEAIESIIRQSYKNFELFIVDDGSIDGSENLIKEYSSFDNRIKHIRFEKNTGIPAYTTSVAYQKSKGEYLAFVFDDCIIDEDHLKILSNALKNNNYGMVYGKAIALIGNSEEKEFGMPYDKSIIDRGDNYIPNVSVMIRRSVIEDVGWYDPHIILKRLCDWDLWKRIGDKYSIGFVDKIIAIEKGIMLKDSLGNNYSVKPDLVLKYANMARNERLRPSLLTRESAFDLEILNLLNDEQKQEFWFLVLEHFINVGQVEEILNNKKINDGVLSLINKNTKNYYKNKNDVLIELISFYYRNRIIDIQSQNKLLIKNIEIQKEQEIKLKEKEHEIKLKEQEIISKYVNSHEYRIGLLINKVFSIFFPSGSIHRKIFISIIKKTYRFCLNIKNIFIKIINFIFDYFYKSYYRFLKALDNIKNKHVINVLSVIEGRIPSVTLGLDLPLSFLEKSKKIRHIQKYFKKVKNRDIEFADIIFFMRNIEDDSINVFNMSKNKFKKIIYCIDDDLECLAEDHPLKQYMLIGNRLGNYYRFLRESDAVCVYSKYFQKKLLKFNNNVFFLSNIAPVEVINNLRKKIFVNKIDKISFGYLGSSPQHIQYFSIIREAVVRILNEYCNEVEFYLIGVKDEILVGYDNVIFVPFIKPTERYYKYMIKNKWDIGLAPILDKEFEKSKTDNKYREYASLGIAGIYSNVIPYKDSVKHNVTGILVENNPECWYQAIKELIQDSNKREMIIKQSYEDVKTRYSLENYVNNYYEVIKKVMED